jgi:hypothetical protein
VPEASTIGSLLGIRIQCEAQGLCFGSRFPQKEGGPVIGERIMGRYGDEAKVSFEDSGLL